MSANCIVVILEVSSLEHALQNGFGRGAYALQQQEWRPNHMAEPRGLCRPRQENKNKENPASSAGPFR